MSEQPAKPKAARPADAADEKLLNDLAAGHVGKLRRRSSAGSRPRAEPPGQPDKGEPALAEQVRQPVARPPAEQPDQPHGRPALEGERPGTEEHEGGTVDALLSAVERIAGRPSRHRPQSSALLGRPGRSGRFPLKPSRRMRAVGLQVAAVAAGVAGTVLLAWLLLG
jgi:hypothetical protein